MWQCCHLGSVATDEVVHGLLLGELADRRQHPKGITAQQYEVLGVGAHAWNPGVVNVVDGVGSARVLGHSAATEQLTCQETCLACRSMPL